MEPTRLKPYDMKTTLTNYLPLPREVLRMGLPSTAVLIYAALLGRTALSKKNHYANEEGWVYVIYTIEKLASTVGVSDTIVKRSLRVLEDKGLICRRREEGHRHSLIYLRVPEGGTTRTDVGTNGGQICTPKKSNLNRDGGTYVPASKKKELNDLSNYYQYEEGESL